MRTTNSLILKVLLISSVSYSQMHTLYGITLTITPEETKSALTSFTLVESDILSKEYIGVNYDNVTLHLSYLNTNTESTNSENYRLNRISRIYNDSSYSEWAKKVSLFEYGLGIKPKISSVDGLPVKIANWRFPQTNTIFNVIYNETEQRTVEMLSYVLTTLK